MNAPVLYCAQKICVNFSNEYFRHTHLLGCDFFILERSRDYGNG